MTERWVDFNEPIFLCAEEKSTFLDGARISETGLLLQVGSKLSPTSGTIEFSFPNIKEIVRVAFVVNDGGRDGEQLKLSFVDLSPEGLGLIKDYMKFKVRGKERVVHAETKFLARN